MKKSASNFKEKIMKLFITKINDKTAKDDKVKKIADPFDDKYIEYKSKGDEQLSTKEYLEKFRPYLSDMIYNFRTSDKWKIQMTMKMNFTSSKNSDEKRFMHSKSVNKEIMSNFDTEETIKELFHSLLQRYQVVLEQSMKGSNFVFHCVEGFFYKCHKVSSNCGQVVLEQSMKGSNFVFQCAEGFFYKCHKVSPNCGRSVMDSPKWLKNEKLESHDKTE